MSWSVEQVMALAPDAQVAGDGRKLASPAKWPSRGCTDVALWGECQGSGKNPYQVRIDLQGPAFKCSCPSRKFPCKHSMALFLMYAEAGDKFPKGEPPPWVEEWLQGRAKRAEKAAQPKAEVVDKAAQEKRAARREDRVTAGIARLKLQLADIMRRGLNAIRSEGYGYWDRTAAALVDAQAPGLARMVHELAGAAAAENWHERLLDGVARIHLVVRAFENIETLPPGMQADVRAQVGWNTPREEVLQQPPVSDIWQVLGQSLTHEDKLRVQRTWLRGEKTGRMALSLHFAAGQQPLDVSLVPGTVLSGELCFYPGAYPLRAMFRQRDTESAELPALPTGRTATQATGEYAAALSALPWIEQFPVLLADAIPACDNGAWRVHTADECWLPVAASFDGWKLLAFSRGGPVTLFGEWDGRALAPLSASARGEFVRLA